MRYIYIKDSVDIEIPQGFKIQDNIQHKQVEVKDAILAPGDFTGKALEITVDATHCGYFNRNNYYYTYEGMAAGAGSFLEPYAKPFLIEHNGSGRPVGRMSAAAFISIPRGTYSFDSEHAKLKGVPTGKVRLKALITDSKAISDILDSRFLTVSIGGRPLEIPICSGCGEKAEAGFFGIHLTCDHEVGEIDEKLGYIGIKVGRMDFGECSFVNHPADYTPEHAAGIVAMSLVTHNDEVLPSYDNIEFGEVYVQDRIQKKEDENMAVSKEVLEKAAELGIEVKDDQSEEDIQALISAKEEELKSQKSDANTPDDDSEGTPSDSDGEDGSDGDISDAEFETLLAEMETALDECEGCDEDISKFWEGVSDEELENIKEMAKEYDDHLEEEDAIPEDKKLSAEARKGLSAKTFCGPDRSFPVPDCAHVTAAKRLIGRYKGSGNKARILACVNRKAKSLGCDTGKDSVDVLAELETRLAKLKEERDAFEAKIKSLESEVLEKDNNLQVSDKRIVELTAELKDAKVEKIIDLGIMMRTEDSNSLISAKNKEEFDKAYSDIKVTYADRELTSLTDKLEDLRKSFKLNPISERIIDPTLDDGREIDDPIERILKGKDNEGNGINVAEIVFGTGYTENSKEEN